MPERLGDGEYRDPDALPAHLRRLHRKIMAAHRAQRQAQVKAKDVDETGRVWPGLVREPKQRNR